jgi:hypothetical protein
MADCEGSVIISVMSNIILERLDSVESARWDQTVRAAHHYLDRGAATKRVRESCEAYIRVADQIPGALNQPFS